MAKRGTVKHRRLLLVDIHAGPSSRENAPWLAIGPTTYGSDVVGFGISTRRRMLSFSWKPAVDKIRQTDQAHAIRMAARAQVEALDAADPEQVVLSQRQMAYALRCTSA